MTLRLARARRIAKRIAPLWTIAVLLGSFLPGSYKLMLGTGPYQLHHPVEWQHRLLHFVIFGVTALILMLAVTRRENETRAAAAAFLLGCVIEVVQWVSRFAIVFEWWDVRDDLFAVVGGWLAMRLLTSKNP